MWEGFGPLVCSALDYVSRENKRGLGLYLFRLTRRKKNEELLLVDGDDCAEMVTKWLGAKILAAMR